MHRVSCLVSWSSCRSILAVSSTKSYFSAFTVGATLAIAYLLFAWNGRRGADDGVALHDLAFAVAALACAAYFASQGQRIAERIEGVDDVYSLDIVFGILLIALLLEGCRRVAGAVLTVVTAFFIFYVFAGPYIPGALGHRGMSLERFIDLQVLSTSGIFGTPISASAHMVFYFVIVGAFLERSGAGKLFVDIAYGLTARAWGGAGQGGHCCFGPLWYGFRQRRCQCAAQRADDHTADEAIGL